MRSAGVPAFLFLLLLAGCAGPGAPSPTASPDAAGPAPVVLAMEPARPIVTVPNTGHEAFIAVAPDGQTVLTCAHGDFREPVHMYASVDGGATFHELDAGLAMLPAGDCHVALGPEGAWSFAGKTEAGITVTTTRDQGATWTTSHLAGPPFNGLADRQWLAYAGRTLVLSYQPGTQQAGHVLVTRSTDFGAAWSSPVEAFGLRPEAPEITAGPFLVAADGRTLHIPGLRGGVSLLGGAAALVLATSTDGGASWTEREVAAASHSAYPTGAAMTPQGVIAWAYAVGEQEGMEMALITSADGGATWSSPVAIGQGAAHERPWASARPDGTVDVVWLSDGSAFGRGVGLALTRLDPARAEPVLAQAIVADIPFIEFAGLAHDGVGRAHVVAMDAPRLMSAEPELTRGLDGRMLFVQEARSVAAPPPTA